MTKLYSKPTPISGFSLIELMIAVAIVAILAAIAYPSYIEQVRKSRRAEGKSVLLQAAQWMERYYTENNRYDDKGQEDTQKGLPFTKAPIEGTAYYDITLAAVARNTFTLNAAPTSGTDQTKDKCQTLTLTNTGLKDVTGSPTMTKEDCWR
jgi:type IV pilus assembly protein PilE